MSERLRTALDAYARECEKYGQGSHDTHLLKTRAEVERIVGGTFTSDDAKGLLEALGELGVKLPPSLEAKLRNYEAAL